MKRFKPGQKIVCVRPTSPYRTNHGDFHNYGPKFNEIVTVSNAECIYPDAITICEYSKIPKNCTLPMAYVEKHFEPLIDDKIISELLEESYKTQPQTI